MTDDADSAPASDSARSERAGPPDAPIDDAPTVSCSRCDQEWSLEFELSDLGVGNQAAEQFALDHQRHTGHFPDDVRPWRATCRRCPETVERLGEQAARRWAAIHHRHTRHAVELRHDSLPEPELVDEDAI